METWCIVCFLLLSAASVDAFIRFPCSQLVTERFDPIVAPGQVSGHVHQIVGGNAFNLTMDPNMDIAEVSTCTTCRFKEDHSNYWTAVLYYKHANGSFIRVPQMTNHNTMPGIPNGGMTVYYFQPHAPSKNIEIAPFPKGFRMLTGNPMRRRDDTDDAATAARAITFRCFHGTDAGQGPVPGRSPDDFVHFPPNICTGGIRSNIFYPQCWDGVNIDTPDHSSHVVHPDGGTYFGTDCPPSHPVRLPLIFIEIVWDTRPFNGELWPKDGSQPFVLSTGDPTGFGQHADYVFGWEGDSLTRAMEQCTSQDGVLTNCPSLTIQSSHDMNMCQLANKVPESVENEWLDKLPGCNPIQEGPDPATLVPNCDAPSTTIHVSAPTASPDVILPPWPVCHEGSGTHPLGVPNCPLPMPVIPTGAPPSSVRTPF